MHQVRRTSSGTRKGASSGGQTESANAWDVSGPHFGGWEIYHLKGSPADPNRRYASPVQRLVRPTDPALDDAARRGRPWQQVRLRGDSRHASLVRGTPRPMGVHRVLHLEPSLTDPTRCTPAFRTPRCFPYGRRAGRLAGAPRPAQSRLRVLLAARRRRVCLHTILLDRPIPNGSSSPSRRPECSVGRRAKTWRPMNRGLRAEQIPNPTAEVGTAFTASPCNRSASERAVHAEALDVMRTTTAGSPGGDQREPADRFGFVVDVHAHEPETIYVVPSERLRALPARRKLGAFVPQPQRVERTWEALT